MPRSITRSLARIRALRDALRERTTRRLAHEFAEIVVDLGYVGGSCLDRLVDHDQLVSEAIRYYQAVVRAKKADASILNNLGVLHSNRGEPSLSRRHIARALALAPRDRTIHENMRIVDILLSKPEKSWHSIPAGLSRGKRSFACYFDPHGM